MPVVHDEHEEKHVNHVSHVSHVSHVAGVAGALACNNLPDMNGASGIGPRLRQQNERRE